jgi:hypothetical protein
MFEDKDNDSADLFSVAIEIRITGYGDCVLNVIYAMSFVSVVNGERVSHGGLRRLDYRFMRTRLRCQDTTTAATLALGRVYTLDTTALAPSYQVKFPGDSALVTLPSLSSSTSVPAPTPAKIIPDTTDRVTGLLLCLRSKKSRFARSGHKVLDMLFRG